MNQSHSFQRDPHVYQHTHPLKTEASSHPCDISSYQSCFPSVIWVVFIHSASSHFAWQCQNAVVLLGEMHMGELGCGRSKGQEGSGKSKNFRSLFWGPSGIIKEKLQASAQKPALSPFPRWRGPSMLSCMNERNHPGRMDENQASLCSLGKFEVS